MMLRRLIRRILFVLFPRKLSHYIICDIAVTYVPDKLKSYSTIRYSDIDDAILFDCKWRYAERTNNQW